jgi:hypothetical protein
MFSYTANGLADLLCTRANGCVAAKKNRHKQFYGDGIIF